MQMIDMDSGHMETCPAVLASFKLPRNEGSTRELLVIVFYDFLHCYCFSLCQSHDRSDEHTALEVWRIPLIVFSMQGIAFI
jgi:hypothetical protein